MSRTYTTYAEHDDSARALLDSLLVAAREFNSNAYRAAMFEIGLRLAAAIAPKFLTRAPVTICVICTVEDADYLAKGVLQGMETLAKHNVSMMCLWNERVKAESVDTAPVTRSYVEPFDKSNCAFIVVKSIISGACVVRTNLMRALTDTEPQDIFVAAPVMHQDAAEKLSREFPESVTKRFHYVNFATDSEKSSSGEEVIPGIGGSVYELLNLGDSKSKNKYVPNIVRSRRLKSPLISGIS